MRQVTAVMVRQENKKSRPRGSHKKLREELGPAFVAWHKTGMLWFKRSCKPQWNRRKCGRKMSDICF